MKFLTSRLSFLLLGLIIPIQSWGCPVCHSGTGAAVRAGIFNENFLFNLGVSVSPFIVLTGVITLLHSTWKDPQ